MNCISRPLKLYVIGNGFDLHHGMPCGYVDFIAWLQGNRHEVYNDLNRIYGYCSGNNWSDFENSLRGFNLDDYPDNVTRDGLMQLKAGLNESLLRGLRRLGCQNRKLLLTILTGMPCSLLSTIQEHWRISMALMKTE